MASRTHYQVLGVDRDASSVDIASAFRDKLAEAKAKPDTAAEQLDALREAYQTLASPGRRAEYDETLAPRVAARPPPRTAPAREVAVEEEARGPWGSPLVRYGVPIAILVVAIWGWKTRKTAPEAQIVSQQVILPSTASQAPRESGEASGGQAVSAAVAPGASGASSRSAEQLFSDVSGSIVRVLGSDSGGRVIQQGSGVVTAPGRVITNCHVAKGAAQLNVKLGAATRPAKIYVADEELDLCSLDVAGLDASGVTIGSVANVRTGQRVYAIGAPLGLDLTISEGIVSSLRDAGSSKVIQTTAPVSPGSSGGGLFSADGQLVGIVTFQHRYGQNLNFAVPADWIGEMRTRGSGVVAVAAATPEPTVEEMVVGKWWCFGTLSGKNGEYTYASNGVLRIVSNDGRNHEGAYRISGRRIHYHARDGAFSLDIETISQDRMVQLVGAGERLACERR
jgi:serine protease Do